MTSVRLTNIDIIRVVSLLLVMLSHYSLESSPYLDGTQGVVLFFFVSGFCIAMTSEKRKTFFDFWRARLIRLLPTFVLSCTFIYLAKLMLFNFSAVRPVSTHDFFMTVVNIPLLELPFAIYQVVTGVPDYNFLDGAHWSLLVEFRFYFLFGLLYFVFRLRRFAGLLTALLSGLSVWTAMNFSNRLNDFFLYLIFFSFGVGHFYATQNISRRLGWGTMLLAVFAFFVLFVFRVPQISMNLSSPHSFTLYAPLFLIYPLLMKYGHVSSAKAGAAISRLAILTYPAYLIHQDLGLIILNICDGLFSGSQYVIGPALIVLMFFVSHFIDRVATTTATKLFRPPA